jgi:hypothetical protein
MKRLAFIVALLAAAASAWSSPKGAAPWETAAADATKSAVAPWLPARTLLVLESADPERLADELARLIADSQLGNYPLQLKGPAARLPAWLAEVASWLSPEGLPELKKCDGAAFAVVEADIKGVPNSVYVLKTGQTSAFHVALKKLLAGGDWREAKAVDGVKTYYSIKNTQFILGKDEEGAPEQRFGNTPVLALFQGGIAYGNPGAVAEVIRRSQGNAVGPPLYSNPRYQEARALAAGPGVFCFAELGKLADAGLMPAFLAPYLPPACARASTGLFRLDRGMISYRGRAEIGDDKAGCLVGAAPQAPLHPNLLAFIPKEAVGFMAASIDSGEQAAQLLALFDQVVKSTSPGARLPGEALQSINAQSKWNVLKEFAPRLRQLAVAQMASTGASPPASLWVFECKDDAARDWLLHTGLVRLAWGIRGGAQPPAWVTGPEEVPKWIDLGGARALHVGQQGRVIVVGMDDGLVSRVCTDGALQQGLRALGPINALFEDGPAPGLIMAVRPHRFAPAGEAIFGARSQPPQDGGAGAADAGAGGLPAPGAVTTPGGGQPQANQPTGAASGTAGATITVPSSMAPNPNANIPKPPLFGNAARLFAAEDWLALGLVREGQRLSVMLAPFHLGPRMDSIVELIVATAQNLHSQSGLPGGGRLEVVQQPKMGDGQPAEAGAIVRPIDVLPPIDPKPKPEPQPTGPRPSANPANGGAGDKPPPKPPERPAEKPAEKHPA